MTALHVHRAEQEPANASQKILPTIPRYYTARGSRPACGRRWDSGNKWPVPGAQRLSVWHSQQPGALSPGALSPGALSPGALSPGALSPGALSPGTLSPGTLAPGLTLVGKGGGLKGLFPQDGWEGGDGPGRPVLELHLQGLDWLSRVKKVPQEEGAREPRLCADRQRVEQEEGRRASWPAGPEGRHCSSRRPRPGLEGAERRRGRQVAGPGASEAGRPGETPRRVHVCASRPSCCFCLLPSELSALLLEGDAMWWDREARGSGLAYLARSCQWGGGVGQGRAPSQSCEPASRAVTATHAVRFGVVFPSQWDREPGQS